MTSEHPEQDHLEPDHLTTAAAVGRFIGGFLGTLALMGLGLAIGTSLIDSVLVGILFTVLVGSLLIVLGAMNGSRPIVAGGVTAFAVVLAVVGGCFMLLVPHGRF